VTHDTRLAELGTKRYRMEAGRLKIFNNDE
jgi:hypothetical protein